MYLSICVFGYMCTHNYICIYAYVFVYVCAQARARVCVYISDVEYVDVYI
jgi:hypothetical protein